MGSRNPIAELVVAPRIVNTVDNEVKGILKPMLTNKMIRVAIMF
jgi:hypothetical protein